MQSFELQVYKGGKWEFDSYFDDRETALFEAGRLHDSDRYHGIRVLEERFTEDSATSDCSVIFSRLRKVEAGNDPRTRASREAYRVAVREITRSDREQKGTARKARKSKSRKKSKPHPVAKHSKAPGKQVHTSLYTLMIMTVLIVVLGVGAMIGLRYMAGTL